MRLSAPAFKSQVAKSGCMVEIIASRLPGYAGDDEQQQVLRCFSAISRVRIATAIKNL